MMCMCVECVGDQPEPDEIKNDDDGKYYIVYKNRILTDGYTKALYAWLEFEYRCKRRLWK